MSSLDAAILAFERGQYSVALPILSIWAAQGDMEAQCMVGTIYDLGLETPVDACKAAKWYFAAAAQGSGLASNNLSTLFLVGGEAFPVDKVEAEKWRQRALDQGFIHAPLQPIRV
jgi:TPR repeat protein